MLDEGGWGVHMLSLLPSRHNMRGPQSGGSKEREEIQLEVSPHIPHVTSPCRGASCREGGGSLDSWWWTLTKGIQKKCVEKLYHNNSLMVKRHGNVMCSELMHKKHMNTFSLGANLVPSFTHRSHMKWPQPLNIRSLERSFRLLLVLFWLAAPLLAIFESCFVPIDLSARASSEPLTVVGVLEVVSLLGLLIGSLVLGLLLASLVVDDDDEGVAGGVLMASGAWIGCKHRRQA
jgi:hypothetical protein